MEKDKKKDTEELKVCSIDILNIWNYYSTLVLDNKIYSRLKYPNERGYFIFLNNELVVACSGLQNTLQPIYNQNNPDLKNSAVSLYFKEQQEQVTYYFRNQSSIKS